MILGIDIGAYKIAAVAWDGDVISKDTFVYPQEAKKDTEAWRSWVIKWVGEFLSQHKAAPQEVGVGIAGVIKDGVVIVSPNLPLLNGQNIEKLFASLSNEARVENDANCFLRAEHMYGAVRGMRHVVGLTLGSGIGGALLINGALYTGAHASAGEIGHVVMQNGTFEKLVSSQAFSALTDITFHELNERARKGDKKALRVFTVVGTALGIGLANLINTLDPEAVVIGGGLSISLDLMLPTVKKEVERFVLNPDARAIPIVSGELGIYAVAIGAALLF